MNPNVSSKFWLLLTQHKPITQTCHSWKSEPSGNLGKSWTPKNLSTIERSDVMLHTKQQVFRTDHLVQLAPLFDLPKSLVLFSYVSYWGYNRQPRPQGLKNPNLISLPFSRSFPRLWEWRKWKISKQNPVSTTKNPNGSSCWWNMILGGVKPLTSKRKAQV